MENIFKQISPKIYEEKVNIYIMKDDIFMYYLESVVVRGAGWLLVVADVLEVLLPDEGATVLYCTVLYCTVLYCTVLYLTPGQGSRSPLARMSGAAWRVQLSLAWHRSSTVRMASSIRHFSCNK